MDEKFERIAASARTHWDLVDGRTPEWKELDAEEKIAYLANFAGSLDVPYTRFFAGVQDMLRIAEVNGYEHRLGADAESVCRSKYSEAMAWHSEKRGERADQRVREAEFLEKGRDGR